MQMRARQEKNDWPTIVRPSPPKNRSAATGTTAACCANRQGNIPVWQILLQVKELVWAIHGSWRKKADTKRPAASRTYAIRIQGSSC